jgi:hypothetical protein
VTAADQLDLALVRADLGEHRRDELLIIDVAGQAVLDPGDDRAQAFLRVRGFAERPEHGGGRLHRGQALALDIPDDEPQPVLGVRHLVQVAAHSGLGGGGQVPHGHLHRADLARHRPQQHLLDGLGHDPDLLQLLSPAALDPGRGHAHRRDGDRDQERDEDRALVDMLVHEADVEEQAPG